MTTVPESPKLRVETPSAQADIVSLPPSLDDAVRVCAIDFPLQDVQCISVGELRTFLFSRKVIE